MLEMLVKKDPTPFQISGYKTSELHLQKIQVLILWRISPSL